MRVPKYRKHSVRNKAFVEVNGRREYLPGDYGSPESRRAYARILNGLGSPAVVPASGATVAQIVESCLDWARGYYAESDEYNLMRYACSPLLELHADTPAEAFGPLALKAVRTRMIDRGWARKTINNHVGRIRRAFRWAVEHEVVSPTVLEGLRAVAPLRSGRSEAADPAPVEPVPAGDVFRILPMLSPVVSRMVQIQRLTGMRSANLCELALAAVDRTGPVWWYRPRRHKSGWRGRVLEVPLGPRSQEILRACPERPLEAPCFAPADAAAWHATQRRAARKTPLTPSQRARTPSRRYRPAYTTRTYYRAVTRAQVQAGVPHWHPHQLRHSVATTVREQFGLEAAQVYLGHARADVTQVYAQRDRDLAARIAAALG